jgi:hypothetical protein
VTRHVAVEALEKLRDEMQADGRYGVTKFLPRLDSIISQATECPNTTGLLMDAAYENGRRDGAAEYREALEQIRDHAQDDDCDGDCARSFVHLARAALSDKKEPTGD